MKPDERSYLLLLHDAAGYDMGPTPRDLRPADMAPKRAWYLLSKWARLGWYDYGVSIDLGWLTPAGHYAAERFRPSAPADI